MARSTTTRPSAGTRALVIVESPAKARTIGGYLGDGYVVEASVGHIRDLPQPSELPADMKKGPYGKFAVDVENGFEPYYVVDADKKKKVTELRRALKDVDELILATDEDREGEAIAWHLLEELQPKVPVKRMVFHEITREAIARALESTRDIDESLVDAQETRRILDRLYGYEVSPVLWRKVRQGLSAGRVQSVATRLVVERERERMAFVAADYAGVQGTFAAPGEQQRFLARLASLDGARVATGRDFDDRGRLRETDPARLVALDAAGARDLVAALDGTDVTVARVEEKPYSRKPAAPFTTSTLQQEAGRKLRLSSKQAMRVAQTLYEGGYITYMRTDSTALSDQAVAAARRQAADLYGAESVPDRPRTYASKAKNAQEAHEAIRPAGDSFRTPAQVAGALRGEEFRLYELIWQRTVASQMADARGTTASVRLAANAGDGRRAEFAASGTVITFRGFLAAYEEGRDADRYSEASDGESRLPRLSEGAAVDVEELLTTEHRTSPPSRYTEASLVKALEERGIGRPSTYAATIGTIIDRGYVRHKGTALVPEWLAFAVTRLLEEHFPRLVDYDFTAEMEADLDRVASGEVAGADWLTRFYFGAGGPGGAGAGTGGLPPLPGGAGQGLTGLAEGLKGLADGLGEIDARAVSTIEIGDGVVLRVGRYGPYLQEEDAPTGADGKEVRASVPDDIAPDELTVERARALLADAAKGDTVLGRDPDTGHDVIVKSGRFGPFVAEVLPEGASGKPRRASLFASMSMDTVTLDDALRLLSLPRVVGTDPQTGEEITAQNGRYGPYLRKGSDSRSLENEEQIFTTSLEEALAIYAQPKRGRGRTAAAPLAELGTDPTSGGAITVRSGRYGDYVSDGETNATLRGDDTKESVTFERAVELLAERRAAGPAKKRGAKKTAAKTTTAKTTTAKKTAAKKTAARKTAAKKASSSR
ncbi:type I DNA topoisomerase [Aquipuribacter nitratireducens]|uniref:DNA topoisomerase 1 n=1 Tax=Aquipuribacter nitratireducens TaxID=650104 RepID=A0ABW0GQU3_9MICO